MIELDEKVITEQLLPNLAKNYFSDSGGANYNLAVLNSQNVTVFQSQNLTATDATVKLFNLSPDNFVFSKLRKRAEIPKEKSCYERDQ